MLALQQVSVDTDPFPRRAAVGQSVKVRGQVRAPYGDPSLFVTGAGAMEFHFAKNAATSVECSSISECTMVTPAQTKAGAEAIIANYGKLKNKRHETPSFIYE